MKKTIIKSLATLALTAGSFHAFSQANDWILPPSTKIHFTTSGSVASSIGTTAIAGCGAGATYVFQQQASTITDAAGNGMTFINNCGAYSLPAVSSLSSYSMLDGYQNVFAVPGLCKTYYAINWEGTGGMHGTDKLTVRYLNTATAGTLTETGSVDLLNDGDVHPFAAIAVAPLAANGTRRVYLTDGTTLKYVQISATGVVGLPTNIRTGIDPVDRWSGFKVVDKGTKILMVAGSTKVKLYDIAADSFVFSYTVPSLTRVIGVEYLPYKGTGGDRIYISYNYWDGTTADAGFKYISYKTAPSTLIYAAATYPTSDAQLGFGYSAIERGKDGRLYIAYNDNFSTHFVSGPGKLRVLDTVGTGTLSEVKIGGTTPVYTNNYDNSRGFVIQKQIQDEDYSAIGTAAVKPDFTVNGLNQNKNGNVTLFPANGRVQSIYRCNGEISLNSTLSGSHTGYTIKVEVGTVSSSVSGVYTVYSFTPSATQAALNTVSKASTASSITEDLITLLTNGSGYSWLTNYSGPIRVTVTNNNPCDSVSSSQFFNLVDPTDFLLTSPKDRARTNHNTTKVVPICNSTALYSPITGALVRASLPGVQDRNTVATGDLGPDFANLGIVDPTQAPPCSRGWLGVTTAGIFVGSINSDVTSTTGTPTSYKIKVEEFTQATNKGVLTPTTNLAGGNIVINAALTTNLSSGGIPVTGYLFNESSDYYFEDNYDDIKGVYVYKVTYSAITPSCGDVSSVSYFKIMDDGLVGSTQGGVMWRGVPNDDDNGTSSLISTVNANPNPVITVLNLKWTGKNNGNAFIKITNAMGQIVRQYSVGSSIGQNSQSIDLENLASGLYNYSVQQNGAIFRGTFLKK